MTFVRAIRDDSGFEIAWYCNGCGEVKNQLWCGLCVQCQQTERRHKEMIAAIKSLKKPEPTKRSVSEL